MFLNRLSLEEKKSFLEISHYIANSDNKYCEKEEVVIAKYCMEMQMDDISFCAESFDLEKCLSLFEDSSHKKICLIEVMALIYADGTESEEERAIIERIINVFNLNPNLAVVYREWAKSILSLFIQGEALIHL